MNVCLTGELAGTHILGRLAACHRGLKVQHTPRYSRVDRAGTKRPPRLAAAAVGTVEHLRTRRIRDDDRPTGDRPKLFCQEWIVRDVRQRLLRQAVGVVKLIRTCELNDFWQRLMLRPPELRVS